MFIFQKQHNFIEIFSGVDGGFKIIKFNKFSGVQKKLKIMVNDNNNQFSSIPNNVLEKKSKILFEISYFNKTIFN